MAFDLTPLMTFVVSRPVLFGAPLAAMLGAILGLVSQVGPQTAAPVETRPLNYAALEDRLQPIEWPAGKVPDHVIGTDFLAEARPRQTSPPQDAIEPPPMVLATPEPSSPVLLTTRPAHDATRWPSQQGDILDLRLPEDSPSGPTLLN